MNNRSYEIPFSESDFDLFEDGTENGIAVFGVNHKNLDQIHYYLEELSEALHDPGIRAAWLNVRLDTWDISLTFHHAYGIHNIPYPEEIKDIIITQEELSIIKKLLN
jgi:hypothetical protein